jgi:hypothetical protein
MLSRSRRHVALRQRGRGERVVTQNLVWPARIDKDESANGPAPQILASLSPEIVIEARHSTGEAGTIVV